MANTSLPNQIPSLVKDRSFPSPSMDTFNASSATSFSFISIIRNIGNDQTHTADFAKLLLNPTIAILLSISAIIFCLVKSWTQKSSVSNLPPGPQPWPLVGNVPELLYNSPGYKWLHSLLHTYETPILCVRLGRVHVIAVNRPDIAREFLKKHDAVFASRPITMATEYCSRGFLSTALVPWGDQWKKMRRVLASEVLSTSRFEWSQGKRMEEADNLVHWIWKQCCTSQDKTKALVNVRTAARQYTGNVIRKLIFNRRYFGSGGCDGYGGPGEEEEEHVEALFKALCLLFNMCVSDYMPCLRWLDIGGSEREMRKAIHTIEKHQSPLIEERFRLKRECNMSLEEPQDWLDILISMKDPSSGSPLLSLEEIKAQVTELAVAAVDNPSNAVEWALAEMLLQPEIMQKAVEEINRVVGRDRLVEEEDLKKLVYVRACAKEAMRLHPVAPFNVPHMAMEDTTVCGYHIPKGSHVILSRVGLGRSPSVWEDPLRFCPDRFIKDGYNDNVGVELTDPQLHMLSFSTGRRGCMGVKLGTSMTIMLLACLLHCFHWSTSPIAPVQLQEGSNDIFMAIPLHAMATPRLPHHLYP